MERPKPDTEPLETPIEPEEIQKARKVVAKLTEFIDAGNLDELQVYVGHRDGTYRMYQIHGGTGRHEDAGRLLELAVMRLGYVDRDQVQQMIEEHED